MALAQSAFASTKEPQERRELSRQSVNKSQTKGEAGDEEVLFSHIKPECWAGDDEMSIERDEEGWIVALCESNLAFSA